jgi:hypothetical protein
MSKESLSNMRFVCEQHAPKPDKRWLKMPVKFYIGKNVKCGFPNKAGGLEHMWVLIKGTRRGLLWGCLDNDPLTDLITPLVDGDECEVKLSEIEAVIDENGLDM